MLVNGRRLEFYTHSDEWCRGLCETIQSARLVYSGAQSTLSLPQELIDLGKHHVTATPNTILN